MPKFRPSTKKVAIVYGIWVLVCLVWSASGFGDSGAAHLHLAVTGLPLAFYSLSFTQHGSFLGALVAGAIGWLQWCLIIEIYSRFAAWSDGRSGKT